MLEEYECSLLADLIALLSLEQRQVVALHYWLDCDEASIGRLMGVSRDRVHQIKRTALGRMRRAVGVA